MISAALILRAVLWSSRIGIGVALATIMCGNIMYCVVARTQVGDERVEEEWLQ